MRPAAFIPAVIALALGLGRPPAQPERPAWWERAWDDLATRVEGAWDEWKQGAEPTRTWGVRIAGEGGARVPLAEAGGLPGRVVLLIHGLDEPGRVYDELVPALREEGHTVALLEYPNDQPIRDSTLFALEWLRAMRAAGIGEIDIVAHSMGGLITRDALALPGGYAGEPAGHASLPDIRRLVMIGVPHRGSAWAKARFAGEVREQAARLMETEDWRELLGFRLDGTGEAARDLLPDSEFLAQLNTHAIPGSIEAFAIVGDMTPAGVRDGSWREGLPPTVAQFFGEDAASELAAEIGDGVVPLESARTCQGLDGIITVRGSHRGMLRTMGIERAYWGLVGEEPPPTPPAIPEVLRLLRR